MARGKPGAGIVRIPLSLLEIISTVHSCSPYHHLCQKGRDKIVEGDLYLGTSKSTEGYAARITFQRAKEEGMEIAIYWQDADSSSAKAEIMLCGGHAGRAHKKTSER